MTSAHGSRSTARSAGGGSPRFSPMTACRGAGASGWNASPSGSRLHTRVIVVYHLDRFARDLAATLDYLRGFSRRGVELHVVGRGRVEADTASGFIVTAVEGLATEHYRRVISEKTRDALARLRPSGSMSGTPSSATMQRTGVHRDHPLELSAPDKGLDTGWTSSQDQAAILPGAGY